LAQYTECRKFNKLHDASVMCQFCCGDRYT